ncbi:hypothetical protein ACWT_1868 [Actinoplanes sp. SE50]|uniref:DUF2278 family protein n=1 Tax=unclassified Actinoplanes TaxID=2626549 RepID=UPI00023EBCDD|nr:MULTISPECIES: DUF2278 family protein [unclassified Actinoplanes]AEV82887.1 hypothetical protein ACPL_1990 [Actinoplanes sp. SE50/110]ATO81283.1 hypothetical protein ACWT_1868 [Actinoplanes sp. SE50]SLL98690.1 hypothetical protein ACSP50_1917 [Actinoplanes sp. SE50/110]
MPIKRYGVLRAAVIDRRIETSDTPHYQIQLRAGGIDYRAAVNVRSQQSPPELLYLAVDAFAHPVLDQLRRLPDGFTELESRSGGPALDYIRSNLFQRPDMRPVPTAEPGPENDLGDFLDHHVRRALGDADARAYVFGQAWGPEAIEDKIFHFSPGNGVHDVHMNQGNEGRFAGDDGVYQDGALLLQFGDAWVAIFLAFQSQAWHTDDITGHKLPDVPGPGPASTDRRVRIVAALADPAGPAPERETVTLVNAGPSDQDLSGWALLDRAGNRQALRGAFPAGGALQVTLTAPVALGNRGGTITLLDAAGLKVDGVAYTADQAGREGWTIVF